MRAVQYSMFGGYEVLQVVDAPRPDPAPGEVLVRISVAGVSPLENTAREGHLPAGFVKPFPVTPGNVGVGTVVEPGCSALAPGTRVVVSGLRYGLATNGTWAEYVAAAAEDVIAIPDAVDDHTAAALVSGAGYLTGYLALTELAGFQPGQAVLAPGAGGAVGQGGVQIAQHLGASAAITTATTTARAEQARAAGYDVIDLTVESIPDGVARLTGGAGVDVVLDGVAGPVTGAALASLAPGGTLISIGYAGGPQAPIAVTDLIWRAAHIHGFSFSLFTAEQIAAALEKLLTLVERGQLNPLTDRVFDLAEAARAQRHLIEGSPFGRVLLTV